MRAPVLTEPPRDPPGRSIGSGLVTPPKVVGPDAIDELIRRMRAENNLMPLPLLETLCATGLFGFAALSGSSAPGNSCPPDFSMFKWVQLAPGHLVEGRRLRWSPSLRKLLLLTADGGWRAADTVMRLLVCSPPVEWQVVEYDEGILEHELVSPELNTVLRIVRSQLPPAGPLDVAFATFAVVDAWGRWVLWDRHLVRRPSFVSEREAMAAADQAISGLDVRYVFLDSFDSVEPGGSS